MNDPRNESAIIDPFAVLRLPQDADEGQVRSRYLELVKQHPPEREPERFREIHAAFELAIDPLKLAKEMLQLPDREDPPTWKDAINSHENRPPVMQASFVLSLGNQGKSSKSKPDAYEQGADDE